MKKLDRSMIMDNDGYVAIRQEFRERIMSIKGARRVAVGPYLTFLFENTDTMHYQVQEMIRAEGIRDERAIEHEITTYNNLIPEPYELSATLLIEIDDPNARAFKLKELLGLDEHVHLLVENDYQVTAQFEGEQIGEERLSSVQYIKFDLGREATEAFLKSDNVAILTTHPGCSFRVPLQPKVLEALREDLKQV